MKETVRLPVDVLQRFMMDVFQGVGIPEADARISAEVLITSDLRGIESHGVGRLKYYYDRIVSGRHQPKTEMEIVKETEYNEFLQVISPWEREFLLLNV